VVGFEINYGQNDFRFDANWRAGAK
jgi:hypothetical protein